MSAVIQPERPKENHLLAIDADGCIEFLKSDAFDAPRAAQSWTSPPTFGRQASLLSIIAELYFADSGRSSSELSNGAGSNTVAPSFEPQMAGH
jgi:hypothetical protein